MTSGPNQTGSARQAALVALVAFAFYGAGVCRFALAGDSSVFYIRSSLLLLDGAAQTHALFLFLAHPFTRIPGVGIPFALGIFAAFWGAVTVGLTAALARRLGGSSRAAWLVSMGLMVSHGLWFHASMAEVYTLNTALLAIVLYGCVRWVCEARLVWLALAVSVAALGLSNHMLMALSLAVVVGWGLLTALFRRQRLMPILGTMVVAGLAGLLPWLVLVGMDAGTYGVAAAARLALVGSTGMMKETTKDWSSAMGGVRSARLVLQLAVSVGMVVYNFPGLVLPAGVFGIGSLRRRPGSLGWLFGALFVVHFGFAATYAINEFWAFLLPCWLVLAIVAAGGMDQVTGMLERKGFPGGGRGTVLLAVLTVATAMAAYAGTLGIVKVIDPRVLREKEERSQVAPDRDYAAFYLWPAKNWVDADARWMRSVWEELPPGSVLVVRMPYLALVRYEQHVLGRRQDVMAIGLSGERVSLALEEGRRVFIDHPSDLPEVQTVGLRHRVRLVRSGPIWEVVPAAGDPSASPARAALRHR